MFDHFFRTIIAHTDDAASISHQWGCALGQGHQRVGADIVRRGKRLTCCVDKTALKRLARRKCHRMQQHVEFAVEVRSDFPENAVNILITTHVAFSD